jgi:uncharacterized protein YcbK (DUF882 family)
MKVAARLAIAIAIVALASLAPATARADVTHVVQRGHTLQAIAHRYHVTEKAIIEANHLRDPKHLKVGQALIIPGVEREPSRQEGDVLHAVRLGEEFRVRLKDAHGRIPPTALKTFERMMRQGEAMHPPDPRLVALVSIVSKHFQGKTIEVVSGYRAYTPTQYTAHSRHNLGKALDFRIRGVSNEALRDFCRTLRNAGCGYYPNSSFVHLDVRDAKAYWVDRSHPGEAPDYDKQPGVAADEGTSDVPDDRNQATMPAASASAPAAPAATTTAR